MTSFCVVSYVTLRSHSFSNRRQGNENDGTNELSSSDPCYSDTDSCNYCSTSPADDRNSRIQPQTTAKQTQIFPLRSAGINRPLSVYDNVKANFSESEDDLDDDVTVTLPHGMIPIATGDRGDTSHFEARMEESLETFDPISNKSPSPFPIFPKQKTSSVQRTPSMDYRTFSSLLSIGDNKAHYYTRSKSWDMTEDLYSPYLEPIRSPSGSKSMDALQDSPGSQFRKVVKGSGIAQLPKPPSALELLSDATKNPNPNNDRRTWEHWSSNKVVPSNDFQPSRYAGKWQESYLDRRERRDIEFTPVRTNFTNEDQHVTSYRIPLKQGHGYNENSTFSNNVAYGNEVSPRRRSSMGYFSYHSLHSQELLNVKRYDDEESTRSLLPSSLSYSGDLSSPNQYHRSTSSSRQNHHNRFPIRHREIDVDPPPYTASNRRQNRHDFSGSFGSGINTSRSKERRKSNVSIAIQTEHHVNLT